MLWAGSAVEPATASVFEIAVFRAFNDAPDVLYPVVWPLMQYGTFITIPVATVIAYCRIGERSSFSWFVLQELLGFQNVKNYDGSWTEYGSLVGVPIEKSVPALVS